MKIAYVGCGFVFDIYMRTQWAHPELEVAGIFDIDAARAETVRRHYGYHVYPDYEALLVDPDVGIVVNLTSIGAHYDVTKGALLAGKHVYSEKPLTTDIDQARELFALAGRYGRILSGAPSNVFGDAVRTMWKAVRDGAIGKPLLVYAELNDNPIHLMRPETWRSPTGAPWPYLEEYQAGCTFEHVGYHLVWICAMFGPATSVTAFSKSLVPHKTGTLPASADGPDFSVACLDFADGVAARITCSSVSPRDHRMHIIGEEGELSSDSYRQYQSAVRLERFSTVSLNARKAYTVRTQPLIGRLFGVGGRSLPLERHWKSHAVEARPSGAWSLRSLNRKLLDEVRRRQVYAQDKLLGIAEMARAIREKRPQPLPPDFLLHLNELTLLIQGAGPNGIATTPTTSFTPLEPFPDLVASARDYRRSYRPRVLERMLAGGFEKMVSF